MFGQIQGGMRELRMAAEAVQGSQKNLGLSIPNTPEATCQSHASISINLQWDLGTKINYNHQSPISTLCGLNHCRLKTLGQSCVYSTLNISHHSSSSIEQLPSLHCAKHFTDSRVRVCQRACYANTTPWTEGPEHLQTQEPMEVLKSIPNPRF